MPHLWKCLRLDWMKLWTPRSSGWHPWDGLPTQTIPCICGWSFKLAELALDSVLAGKLNWPRYLLFLQFFWSLQSSVAITLYVLLVHWFFFFPWYHFRGLYQFSTSVVFKFYMFIALLIIIKRVGEERKGRKIGYMLLLLIYNGCSNVPIVHCQLLTSTTVNCNAMCCWSVETARNESPICFLFPLTLHDCSLGDNCKHRHLVGYGKG